MSLIFSVISINASSILIGCTLLSIYFTSSNLHSFPCLLCKKKTVNLLRW
nr:MAG TPA: hypothetical protein [Caudoviricetes sp.]